jgi:hypothetical protein
MTRQAFTLKSIEQRQPLAHTCRVLNRVDDGGSPDKLLVEIDPPAPGQLYRQTTDVSRVVLSPRHVGVTLYPQISEWPCHVHICVPKLGGTWTEGPFEIADWGILERAP